jgi:hypothetical protein
LELIKIGNTEFSKIICGTNPFYAHSHFSEARDLEYKNKFSDAEIEKTIRHCFENGINTLESSANEKIFEISQRIKDQTDKNTNFIGTTRIDNTSSMKRHENKLSFLIAKRANICLIHSQYIERERKNDTINGIEKLLDEIHLAGLTTGISTHSNDIVELCEKKNYPVDVYMFPLNITGFIYPGYKGKETPKERSDLIQSISKPFIIIKTLGAGRIPPSEALDFIKHNSKKNDLISVGFASFDEVNETLKIWENLE